MPKPLDPIADAALDHPRMAVAILAAALAAVLAIGAASLAATVRAQTLAEAEADALATVARLAPLQSGYVDQTQAWTAGQDAEPEAEPVTPDVHRCQDVPASVAPPNVSRWCDEINEAADRWGLDPRALTVLVAIESAGNPEAVSGAGATGLTQQMPGTAEMLTASTGLPCGSRAAGVNTDPATNLACGSKYLVDGMRAAATIWRAGDEAQHLGAAGIGFHDGLGVLPLVVSHWQAGGHVCEAPVSDYGRLWCRQMVDAWEVMTASPAPLDGALGIIYRPRP